jgi:hypothetical protein
MLRTAEAVAAEALRLVPIYQVAFAGEPWREVSACAAPSQFEEVCPGGRSPQGIGETCARCGEVLCAPAFSGKRLTADWTSHFDEHDSRFYLERLEDDSCVLAALAWKANAKALADRCYSAAGEREMRAWLIDRVPGEFVWLEDIFANLALRPTGNLWNYREMISQFLSEFESSVFAFRSINERLIEKTVALFGSQAERLVAGEDVPDRRNFVLVRFSA